MTDKLQKQLLSLGAALQKEGFAPMPPGQPAIPADPMMAQMGGATGGAPPMDPSMMGGAPPMDPAMAGGMPPMDPAMMAGGGGMPMDPSMAGGMPPVDPAMLAALMGGAPGGAPAPEGEEEGGRITNKEIMDKMTGIEEMLNLMMNQMGIVPPVSETGMMTTEPTGSGSPEELAAALEQPPAPPAEAAPGGPISAEAMNKLYEEGNIEGNHITNLLLNLMENR